MVVADDATDIRDLPDELLIEIFERIPFDHLHGNVKLVCRAWRHVIIAHFRYPRALLVEGSEGISRVHRLTAARSQRISLLKLTDAFDESTMTCLKSHRWPNLRTLIVRSTWTNFLHAHVNVADLNELIDSSPRLRYVKIRECFVHGDLPSFIERLQRRKIVKLALLNRYYVVENVDRLYDLGCMRVFRVFCHFSDEDAMHTTLDKFIANNGGTLTDLALYAPQRDAGCPRADDVILTKVVSSCGHLSKLTLAGRLKVSERGLALVMHALPKLRGLKIDVSWSMSAKIVARFLSNEGLRRLRSLKVSWYRRTTLEELQCLARCGRHLTKLSVEFWRDDGDLLEVSPTPKKMVTTSELREFIFLSTDVESLSILRMLQTLLSGHGDLARVKFVFAIAERGRWWRYNNIEQYLRSLVSCSNNFSCECSFDENQWTVTLTKKILCSR